MWGGSLNILWPLAFVPPLTVLKHFSCSEPREAGVEGRLGCNSFLNMGLGGMKGKQMESKLFAGGVRGGRGEAGVIPILASSLLTDGKVQEDHTLKSALEYIQSYIENKCHGSIIVTNVNSFIL